MDSSCGKVSFHFDESDGNRLFKSKPKWCGAANGPSASSSSSAGSERVPLAMRGESPGGGLDYGERHGGANTADRRMAWGLWRAMRHKRERISCLCFLSSKAC